ncbi:hypothetical protein TPHA_0E03910 [Tetrapisispora phaffii CBS 4417]|uniref:Uncharacterized protein n=1 Tax=Tetrapisispora phaffii (strain ATCC 24235 / CBS 4417 / NBRC 1672 / NRRL Y-8282 / UCD 70-5) TaxID=1071381 RepID=G8BUA2_TETPH|nr:hypothetical protein TPHA_0E03910 [Tetrapisispora phaffii CBS 4417]CCE63480.1 hypothetical protein TPHA_0E03910 [Tetrapisispora phaffii CBS 4417]
MLDTQNLTVSAPKFASQDTAMTPSRRGHRHKRSFAISGDFEFLKQPQQLQGQDSPELLQPPLSAQSLQYSKVSSHEPPKLYISEQHSALQNSGGSSENNMLSSGQNPFQSPRFFASEEPTFSSPFEGVPDAIINLDDALRAKPGSFQAHRRTESAPADLEFLLDAKTLQLHTPRIEEEEMSDIAESDISNSPKSNKNRNDKQQNNPGLLSPLRPYTELKFKKHPDNDEEESPSHSRLITPSNLLFSGYQHSNNSNNGDYSLNSEAGTNLFNNQFSEKNPNPNLTFTHTLSRSPYNSLKINKQKQRSYNRQLPLSSAATVQPQTVKEKSSANSLSSTFLLSPASQLHSPSKPISTPGTPISYHYKQKLNGLPFPSQPASKPNNATPLHSFQQRSSVLRPSSASNAHNSRFNFESKEYDLDYNKLDDFYGSKYENYDNKDLMNNNSRFESQKEAVKSNKNEDIYLSEDLLLGEPGAMVDLSSTTSPVKGITKAFDSLKIDSAHINSNDMYINSGDSSKISLSSSLYDSDKIPTTIANKTINKSNPPKNRDTQKSSSDKIETDFTKDDHRSVSDTALLMKKINLSQD